MRSSQRLTIALVVLAAGLGAAGTAAARSDRGGMLDFEGIDGDGNGMLERGEIEARGTERLARLDDDGDGSISREEIIAAMPTPPGMAFDLFGADPAAERADRVLEHFGAAQAGRIEIQALVAERVDRLFELFDTNDDNAISEEGVESVRTELRTYTGRRGDGGGRHHHRMGSMPFHDGDGPRGMRRDDD
jgi:Ca2+-binding EF-hand superfamily protein